MGLNHDKENLNAQGQLFLNSKLAENFRQKKILLPKKKLIKESQRRRTISGGKIQAWFNSQDADSHEKVENNISSLNEEETAQNVNATIEKEFGTFQ